MGGNYFSNEIEWKKPNSQSEDEIKKLKIELALMKEKWHTETVKIEDTKLKKGNGNRGGPRLKTLTH